MKQYCSQNTGPLMTTCAFVIWGFTPLYFSMLPSANVTELFILRVVVGLPMLIMLVNIFREKHKLWKVITNPRELLILGSASLLYAISWYSFIWTMTHGRVLEASLGFFITPVFNIILAVILLKERLNTQHYLAVILAIAGITYMSFAYRQAPWLAILMGSLFAVYGLLKKYSRAPDISAVCTETLIQLPIITILFFVGGGIPSFSISSSHKFMLYIGAALLTMLPIIIFSFGVVRTRLSTVGFLQYIEPSLAFIIGCFILKEPLDLITLTGFCFIWTGLIFTMMPSFKNLPFKIKRH